MNRYANRSKTLSKAGRLVVLSSPSGGGKSTIIKELLRRRPDFVYSISCTTRKKRDYEVDDVHYHFISIEEFSNRITEGRFLEWEEVHSDFYGTDRLEVEALIRSGKSVLLDLDVNGGEHVQEQFPDSILIFLYPPSLDELRRRLRLRGSDDEESIERRISRYQMEKVKGDRYPNRLRNEDLEATIQEVLDIIERNS